MRTTSTFLALAAVSTVLSACERPPAWGEFNHIIVGTSEEQWAAVSDLVESALEARIITVRAEKTFVVTHQDPFRPEWARLRRFRQLLLIGTTDDPWMTEALALAKRTSFDPPEIFQVQDVWARGQTATVLLLTSGDAAEAEPLMEALHDLLDRQYRQWVRSRMFMTGLNEALADSLWDIAQFSIVLPRLYQHRHVDSVFIFRNDNPDPTELIRQITVTWRTYSPEGITEDELLAWRQEVVDRHFSYPQVLDLELAQTRRLQQGDIIMDEIRAVWANPPEDAFPAGGPMITRSIPCPHQGRDYLVDAWLYAPSRDKYQYILQLETILNSFRCSARSELASASL
ncbi:MAG: DUF4837 family protein [Acidobacteria bacterium]|nr:DUF4837 family protein [Acidobacteriota bacterium]